MAKVDQTVFFEDIYPHFLELSKKKRPSRKEEEAIEYIKSYIEQLGLKIEIDSLGNMAAYREASEGCEHLDPILFQGHIDMVCVPNEDIFPIEPKITDGWVHTDGSTLGADNGIAIAFMFELMKMSFEKNPPMEFLFTVSEEVGLIGASSINSVDFSIKSTKLINVDSEDIDHITVGCSGGTDMEVFVPYSTTAAKSEKFFEVKVNSLGGHSGLEIHKDIQNTIKVTSGFLASLDGLEIAEIKGGLARNAIPPETISIIGLTGVTSDELNSKMEVFLKSKDIVDKCEYRISDVPSRDKVMFPDTQANLLGVLNKLPHGVLKMNPDTGGVLTSLNLATVEVINDKIEINLNTRSSDKAEMDSTYDTVEKISKEFNASSAKGDNYPGWRPNMDSELLKVTASKFEELRRKKPEYLDIHAGLECGILMNKFPTISESVSIGPNIRNAHSVKETLEVDSTVEIWHIVKKIIEHYSK